MYVCLVAKLRGTRGCPAHLHFAGAVHTMGSGVKPELRSRQLTHLLCGPWQVT